MDNFTTFILNWTHEWSVWTSRVLLFWQHDKWLTSLTQSGISLTRVWVLLPFQLPKIVALSVCSSMPCTWNDCLLFGSSKNEVESIDREVLCDSAWHFQVSQKLQLCTKSFQSTVEMNVNNYRRKNIRRIIKAVQSFLESPRSQSSVMAE